VRIGIHARTGGDLRGALTYAAEVGAECVQVFAKSPKRWYAPDLDPTLAAEVRDLAPACGVAPLFTHTAYLINLGSADDALWLRSTDALADELRRGAALGARGVVTHIGTNPYGDVALAASRIARAAETACSAAGDDAARLLLLENSAGAGSSFGGSFEELSAVFHVLDGTGLDVGVCLDTCHAHAYGYELSSADAWVRVLDGIDGCCGTGRLRLLHANDCGFPLGSRRDRHAWIGDGAIGQAGFEAMVCQERLADVPAVMEMPGDPPGKDVVNLTRLKTARDACAGRGGGGGPRP